MGILSSWNLTRFYFTLYLESDHELKSCNPWRLYNNAQNSKFIFRLPLFHNNQTSELFCCSSSQSLPRGFLHAMIVCMWKPENNFVKLLCSFHFTLVLGIELTFPDLYSKPIYSLRHLTSPKWLYSTGVYLLNV